MKNYNMILIEKQQKYQHLSSCKNDKYEYLTGEEIVLSSQSQLLGPAKFTYLSLAKVFKSKQKQLKIQEKNNQRLRIFKAFPI